MAKKFFTALVAVALVATATVVTATAADKIDGELVSIQLTIDDVGAVRMFEPKDVAPVVAGDNDNPTKYFRFAQLEREQEYNIVVKPHRQNYQFGVGVAIDGHYIWKEGAVPADVQFSETWERSMNLVDNDSFTIRHYIENGQSGRRFRVTDESRSLATKLWHDPSANGTIVIAVFREDISRFMKEEEGTRSVKGLGTTAGTRERISVVGVPFTPRSLAYEVFVIRYASKAELKELKVWTDPTPAPKDNRFWPAKKDYLGQLPE